MTAMDYLLAILAALGGVSGLALLFTVWRKPGRPVLLALRLVDARLQLELPRLARAVKKATGCDGVNIVQNNEAAAGQIVFHAHFHVYPRWKDDGKLKLPPSAKDMIKGEDAAAILASIQENLDEA